MRVPRPASPCVAAARGPALAQQHTARPHWQPASALATTQQEPAVMSAEDELGLVAGMQGTGCAAAAAQRAGAGAAQAEALGTPQRQPGAVRSGGALPSSLAPQGGEREVPRTLPAALAVFLSHPSALLILAGLAGLAAWRAQLPARPAADAAVAAAVAAGWALQEWLVHRLLLHSSFDWLGRRIHEGHHQRPYYHVSIDDPPIVLGFMSASLALFWLGFGGGELAVTAALAYYAMGLCYEFTHFIVHTRYLPTSRLGKRIRMHHLLHHTKNEAYWLAFTVPQVDALLGTSPAACEVRMSAMAKAGLQAARSAR